jgi:hypothetical protein
MRTIASLALGFVLSLVLAASFVACESPSGPDPFQEAGPVIELDPLAGGDAHDGGQEAGP